MKTLTALATLCLCLATARADVAIKFSSTSILTNDNQPLDDGSLVILIANVGTATTSPTGFATLTPGTLNIGDYLNGGAYQILGRTYVDGFLSAGAFSGVTPSLTLTSDTFPFLNTGDQLGVVWFPTLKGTDAFGGEEDFTLLSNTSYGLYTASDALWTVPADGTILTDGYADVPDGTAASHTVAAIPEPATSSACAGLLALAVVAWRRRARA